jgi:hypothetical protein
MLIGSPKKQWDRKLNAYWSGMLIYRMLISRFYCTSMRVRMGTSVTSDPTAALTIFSIFCFGQGVGNVLAGPISGVLLSHVTEVGRYGAMRYKDVVIFTGCCMVFSALSVAFWYLRPSRIRT